ncbi:MAG: efflux transporter outer membrane subunit [Phycisphaerae bacterium]
MIPWRMLGSFLPAVLLAAGCVKPAASPARMDPPERFSGDGNAPRVDRWWTVFDDDGLNRAVDAALGENFSLAAAWDRLRQAQAVARREGAPLAPSVDLSGEASRTATRRNDNTTHQNSFLTGLVVSYEVDLWGRIRTAHQAARLDVQAAEQDLQAAAVTLSASVVNTWFRLAEASGQVRLIDEQTETNRQVLELLRERFRQGKVKAADVLRQEQLMLNTQGLATLARRREQTFRHQLAVLMGRAPLAKTPLPQANLPAPGRLPQTGVPAELMRRRPDVRRAYLRVLSQDRRLASAIAARYPRLSLSASLQTSADKPRDLFDDWLSTLAANVLHPLFDGGRLDAEEDRNRAALSESFHDYAQTVLEAVQDVEDALAREDYQQRFVRTLATQLATADDVVQRTRTSYLNGQLDYIRVLEATTSRQSLERQYITARRELLEFRVGLHRALAGPLPLQAPEPLSPTTATDHDPSVSDLMNP